MFLECYRWEELLPLDKTINSEKIYRSEKVQKKYDQHTKKLKKFGLTNEDYIFYLYPELLKDEFVLVENKYPYNLSKNIKHLLLWIPPTYTDSSFSSILSLIQKLFRNRNTEIIVFENSLERKSIPGIRHFHILKRT